MSSLTSFLSKVFGLFCVLFSLTMFTHREATIAQIQSLFGSPATIMMLSLTLLAAGIAMVVGHNVWSGGLTPVLVTMLGWAMLLKAILVSFLTPVWLLAYFSAIRYDEYFYAYAAVALILGAYLSFAGFFQPLRDEA